MTNISGYEEIIAVAKLGHLSGGICNYQMVLSHIEEALSRVGLSSHLCSIDLEIRGQRIVKYGFLKGLCSRFFFSKNRFCSLCFHGGSIFNYFLNSCINKTKSMVISLICVLI